MRVLVTGGAGFIGSHTVDALLRRGYQVRVLDNIDPQVHGEARSVPDHFNANAELRVGDVRDRDTLRAVVDGVDALIHLAAAVGVGQSMYEIRRYVDVNSMGAATLLDVLANERHKVQKLVVASSMSIYGEGAYTCDRCGEVWPRLRPATQLEARDWEMKCPRCRTPVCARPTSEAKPLYPTSIYAVTKRDHEEMFLAFGAAYGVPTAALRYFNVYGTRQALSNPYTGVVAIFASRMMNGHAPVVFEDGRQSRDFTHVDDIVAANVLALESDAAAGEVFNVGTGCPTSILEVAQLLASALKFDEAPEVVNQFRAGDVRHCYSDIAKIGTMLGYEPSVPLADGLGELVEWLSSQSARDDVETARKELLQRGLIR